MDLEEDSADEIVNEIFGEVPETEETVFDRYSEGEDAEHGFSDSGDKFDLNSPKEEQVVMTDGGVVYSHLDSYSTEMNEFDIEGQTVRRYRVRDEDDEIVASMSVELSDDECLSSASNYEVSGFETESVGQSEKQKDEFIALYEEARTNKENYEKLMEPKLSGSV